LGAGQIKLLGQKKRPWLEIRRCETDLTYLTHQCRHLHKLHDGPLDSVTDTVQTDGFYDVKRLRCHGEGLYRAYELLYPRDEKTITLDLLMLTGLRGVASFWCDCGESAKGGLVFNCPGGKARAMVVHDWLTELGFTPYTPRFDVRSSKIHFRGDGADHFASTIRPLIPRYRHSTLRR
jgi:hypothetical protein